MKYKEGPWWVPALIMGALFLAITRAPEASGAVVHDVFAGLGSALDAAVPDHPTTVLPEPE